MVHLFGTAYAAPNKGTTILYWYRSPKTVLNPPVNGKIQGFLSVFQVLFKAKLIFKDFTRQSCMIIQVLFKPVQTLLCIDQNLINLYNFSDQNCSDNKSTSFHINLKLLLTKTLVLTDEVCLLKYHHINVITLKKRIYKCQQISKPQLSTTQYMNCLKINTYMSVNQYPSQVSTDQYMKCQNVNRPKFLKCKQINV